ncbi:MAG: MBOAT family protein [Clostridia bacterium]|nr:MBOAT family protein [Clostridia bacterium]
MVFSSAIFLFGFLPLLLGLYFLAKDKYRNYILLIFSLIFYGFGGPKLLIMMIAVVMIDYITAILVDKYKNEKVRKLVMILTVVLNIGTLFYFKYMGFTVSVINRLASLSIPVPEIVLPIGISFYTFQAMSYTIDVYRREVKANKNPFSVLLYVSMFPQLVAGPIVRYKTVAEEIEKRQVTLETFTLGLERFIFGLAKKLVIANNTGKLADTIFEAEVLATPMAWLGAIAYALQIYFDFSAYSDMAIGLGKMFGFNFEENFNYPYISKSVTEFWRRWHISLSTWFRDYVYIPLGGNRKGVKRQIINLFIVWSLTGIWHGAATNFLLWGLYYFVFLVLEKFVLKKVLYKLPKWVGHVYTLFVVLIGWVLFRAVGLSECIRVLKAMFIPNIVDTTVAQLGIYIQSYGLYILAGIILSMPVFPKLKEYITSKYKEKTAIAVMYYLFVLGIFALSVIFLSQATYNPFIYFRF